MDRGQSPLPKAPLERRYGAPSCTTAPSDGDSPRPDPQVGDNTSTLSSASPAAPATSPGRSATVKRPTTSRPAVAAFASCAAKARCDASDRLANTLVATVLANTRSAVCLGARPSRCAARPRDRCISAANGSACGALVGYCWLSASLGCGKCGNATTWPSRMAIGSRSSPTRCQPRSAATRASVDLPTPLFAVNATSAPPGVRAALACTTNTPSCAKACSSTGPHSASICQNDSCAGRRILKDNGHPGIRIFPDPVVCLYDGRQPTGERCCAALTYRSAPPSALRCPQFRDRDHQGHWLDR